MKKGFGWVLIIIGTLSVLRGFLTLSIDAEFGGRLVTFAIGFILLGIWMVNSSKSKTKNKE